MATREIRDDVLVHLRSIDAESPQIDREGAERWLGAYLEALELTPREVRWLPNIRVMRDRRRWPGPGCGQWGALFARQARLFSRSRHWPTLNSDRGWERPAAADNVVLAAGLGRSASARTVAEITPLLLQGLERLWDDGVDAPRRPEALVPLAAAAAHGLLCFAVEPDGRLACVERPMMRLDEAGLPHDWDGRPGAEWPDGFKLWFWRGVEMTESAGRHPEGVDVRRILGWANAERRRVAIERIGLDSFLRLAGGEAVQQDDYGRLWRTPISIDGEPYVAVEVVNATAEPDGTYRRYFLRVPPTTRTARAAVAWTFGRSAKEFEVAKAT